MARPRRDTSALLDAMAAHVLAHGLNAASLRPLAKAAGTSDRMLIYHFGSKDGLIAALLDHLSAGLERGLDAALPRARARALGDAVAEVVAILRSPGFAPYAALWFDILSAGARGEPAHAEAARRILEGYRAWIAARLPEGADPDLALAVIEGAVVLDAAGQHEATDRAVAALATR